MNVFYPVHKFVGVIIPSFFNFFLLLQEMENTRLILKGKYLYSTEIKLFPLLKYCFLNPRQSISFLALNHGV
jgi:hypothetical protein